MLRGIWFHVKNKEKRLCVRWLGGGGGDSKNAKFETKTLKEAPLGRRGESETNRQCLQQISEISVWLLQKMMRAMS